MNEYCRRLFFATLKFNLESQAYNHAVGLCSLEDILLGTVDDFVVDLFNEYENTYCANKYIEYTKEKKYDNN